MNPIDVFMKGLNEKPNGASLSAAMQTLRDLAKAEGIKPEDEPQYIRQAMEYILAKDDVPAEPKTIAEMIGANLIKKIKGVKVKLGTSPTPLGLFPQQLITITYKCPCGEESYASHMYPVESSIPKFALEKLAELETKNIMEGLRKHIISEGNTPDF